MPNSSVIINADIGGAGFYSQINRTASGAINHSVTLAASQAGTLTTRTSDTEGTLTLGADHGIETADVIDLYWDGGRRYGVVVGTVAGTSVPISGGAGDVLPAQDTACVAAPRTELDTDFNADLASVMAAMIADRGRVEFHDSGGLELGIDMAASEMWLWIDGSTAANPLAGDTVDKVYISHASSTATAVAKVGVLYDSEV
ncbi:MAG: hypothetical protein JXO22_02855 [Phycisphaerae bacterium]|nr:hypothetical protein [Phycisphaerae bacterium]